MVKLGSLGRPNGIVCLAEEVVAEIKEEIISKVPAGKMGRALSGPRLRADRAQSGSDPLG